MANQVIYEVGLKDNMSRGLDDINGHVNKLESSLSGLGAGIAAGLSTIAVGAFVKSMLDAGTSVENARTGLTTLLRDGEAANAVIKNTMADATATPFAFEGLLAANKALIGAGIEAKKAREDVLNLANAIAATGGGDDELQRMVINLQQISNTGKATALDIKQFAFAGVNIYKVLAAAGIKAGEDTVITYDQITMALKKAHEAGGIYYNGLENMAGNTSVKISNLGDALFQLKVKMFDDLKPAIDTVIRGLASFIETLRKAWDWGVRNAKTIKEVGLALAATFVTFKLLTVVPAILLAVENALVAAATGGVSFGAAMTAALGPIGLIAIAVGGLVYAFTALSDAMEDAKKKRAAFLDESSDKEVTYLEELAKIKGGGDKGKSAAIEQERKMLAEEGKRLQDIMNSGEGTASTTFALEENLRKRNTVDRFEQGLIPKKGTAAAKSSPNTPAPTPKTQAVGHKSVTINVTIKELGKTTINATNIKEGAKKMHDHIVGALTGAVNDFQVIAGNT